MFRKRDELRIRILRVYCLPVPTGVPLLYRRHNSVARLPAGRVGHTDADITLHHTLHLYLLMTQTPSTEL